MSPDIHIFSSLNMIAIDGKKCLDCWKMHCLTLLKITSLPFEAKHKVLTSNTNRGPCVMCIVQAHTWCKHASLFKIIGDWKKYCCINVSRVCEICEHCLQKLHKVAKRERNEGVND